MIEHRVTAGRPAALLRNSRTISYKDQWFAVACGHSCWQREGRVIANCVKSNGRAAPQSAFATGAAPFHNRSTKPHACPEDDPWTPDSSRYHEVYARWQRDPEGFWAEAAQEIDWIEPPKTHVRSERRASTAAGSPDGVCNTCWNAVDRHVMAGRGRPGRRSSTTPRRRRRSAPSPTRELQTETQVLAARAAGLRRRARATASSSTCRWCRRR